jgi:hypothetical protein
VYPLSPTLVARVRDTVGYRWVRVRVRVRVRVSDGVSFRVRDRVRGL